MSFESGTRPKSVSAPLPPSWPYYSESTIERVSERIRAGRVFAFGNDPALDELESWARGYFGVEFALATSSGTSALHSAFVGINLAPGDEVLVPTYTFHATATPLLGMGVIPVLYDCLPDSPLPDLEDLRERITPRTKAIVVSHMFGLVAEMSELLEIAEAVGIPIIEDAAQAHGAHDAKGQKAGTFGRAGCFSMGGQKMISGGMGGLLITDERDVFERALNLGHAHERAQQLIPTGSPRLLSSDVGGGQNFRMHPIAALLALEHATTLDERIAIRSRVLEDFSDVLSEFPFLNTPSQESGTSRGGWYGYKALYDSELLDNVPLDALVTALRFEGLNVTKPSTRPLHQTSLLKFQPPCVRGLDFPNATALFARTLGFPDKNFHAPCPDVFEQYGAGIRKVSQLFTQESAA